MVCCAGKVPLCNMELSGDKEEQEWDLGNGVLLKCKVPGAPGHQGFP